MKILARSFRAHLLRATASLIIVILVFTALLFGRVFDWTSLLACLTPLIFDFARLPFETKELEVSAGELAITTFTGKCRRWRLDRLTRVVHLKAGAVLEFEGGETLQFNASKESTAAFVGHLVSQLKLTAGESTMGGASFVARRTLAFQAAPKDLTCPACRRRRPSKYWFQTPDGASSEVCVDCQAPADRLVAAS